MQTSAVLFSCSYVYLSDSDAGHQGSTLSDPRKTTGFGPFKLPTRGPLQKGRDHSPPKACFEEPSTRKFNFFFCLPTVLNIHVGCAQALTRCGELIVLQ